MNIKMTREDYAALTICLPQTQDWDEWRIVAFVCLGSCVAMLEF